MSAVGDRAFLAEIVVDLAGDPRPLARCIIHSPYRAFDRAPAWKTMTCFLATSFSSCLA
jgi:hypothetical protein